MTLRLITVFEGVNKCYYLLRDNSFFWNLIVFFGIDFSFSFHCTWKACLFLCSENMYVSLSCWQNLLVTYPVYNSLLNYFWSYRVCSQYGMLRQWHENITIQIWITQRFGFISNVQLILLKNKQYQLILYLVFSETYILQYWNSRKDRKCHSAQRCALISMRELWLCICY